MFPVATAWVRRNLAWSNSRRSWEERLAFVLLTGGAAALWWLHVSLPPVVLVVLSMALVLAFAVLLRRGWLRLFGPVLFYDLFCTARRTRYVLLRWGYVLMLAVLLVYLWWALSLNPRGRSNRPADAAEFASVFFYVFMVIQFLTVSLLTPAYTAGAIASEKEARTLEFLLASDLRSREIVLGKLVSRICNLLLIVLAGLPILSFLQFLGGIDPELVLAGFLATMMTLVSLAALSICCSVMVRKARDAIMLTYLTGVLYLLVSLLLFGFLRTGPGTMLGSWSVALPLGGGRSFVLTPDDVGEWLAAGNIIVALQRLFSAGTVSAVLPAVFRDYVVFHGLTTVVFATWAVLRLRPIALKETYGRVRKLPLFSRVFGRPAVGTMPMLWKEMVAEAPFRFPWFFRLAFLGLIILSFLPPVLIIEEYFRRTTTWRTPYEMLGTEINVYVRIVGTLVMSVMLVLVAVRAATSVTGERARQTLDALLTTPLSADSLLFPRVVGAVLSVRWLWLWPLSIWMVGLVTGGLSPFALPLLVGAWLVYACCFALLGLWFSVVSRSNLLATLWTVLGGAGVTFGHWLVMALLFYLPMALLDHRGSGEMVEFPMKLQFGQTPPLVLGFLALRGNEFDGPMDHHSAAEASWHLLLASFFGLGCWALAAFGLWCLTRVRFQRLSNRLPRMRPDIPEAAWRMQRRGPRQVRPTRTPARAAEQEDILEVVLDEEIQEPPRRKPPGEREHGIEREE